MWTACLSQRVTLKITFSHVVTVFTTIFPEEYMKKYTKTFIFSVEKPAKDIFWGNSVSKPPENVGHIRGN